MTIAFVHNNKAFLPETEAYIQFFSAYNIQCESVNVDEVGLIHRNVEWRLMGMDLTKPREGILKIHEYTSASVPPARKWKNWTKAFFNSQPDFRLFLNQYVKDSIHIHDHIPFGFRDMGIPASWLSAASGLVEKEYDFVYLGDITAFREPERLLNCFATGKMANQSLLMIATHYEKLAEIYRDYKNITFIGPIPHDEIPAYLKKASFGFNYIADKEPANRQTSTKFLEYAACGIPIVSTDYFWVRQFQQQFGGNYCFVKPDLSDLNWEDVINYNYSAPNLSSWTWDCQIRKSGVLEFLHQKFPEMVF